MTKLKKITTIQIVVLVGMMCLGKTHAHASEITGTISSLSATSTIRNSRIEGVVGGSVQNQESGGSFSRNFLSAGGGGGGGGGDNTISGTVTGSGSSTGGSLGFSGHNGSAAILTKNKSGGATTTNKNSTGSENLNAEKYLAIIGGLTTTTTSIDLANGTSSINSTGTSTSTVQSINIFSSILRALGSTAGLLILFLLALLIMRFI